MYLLLLLIAIILLVIILLNLVVLKKIINTGYIIEKLIVLVFKGTYGVTVITNKGNGWERSIKLDKLCYSREEAIEYIKSLGDKEDEI